MLYEIRIYTAAPNRADPLRERFRDHTLRLFARHGIEVVGCWVPPEQPDQLVYMTRFPDEPARKAAWDGFGADAEWKRIKAESEVNGPLLGGQSAMVLRPTDFSPTLR
ncbi:NIPSNAP family protein [Ferrovibrio xuzhouensis]|uniref:NIPSNAP family protein n=1 Tax=Ferrovibrio xuzhouensis TaxID=1576914 RepID=A0ABV7VBN5_9PROT